MPLEAAIVLLATFQTPRASLAWWQSRVISNIPRCVRRSSRGTSTPPVRHRRDIRHRRGAPCRPARTMPLAPCLGPFVVPANCAVSATPPSRTCVRIDRSVVAVAPRRHRACSRRDLYPTNTPSTRHILKLVSRRRRDSAFRSTPSRGTAVGWAVLLISTSVEVCVARERARGLETRRSRRLACRAPCRAAWRCQRCAPRSLWAHFGCQVFFAICSA